VNDVRVAVVIPCFNDGATVGEAVRSAQAQEPSEIVVVDDGSDDAGTLAEFDRLEAEGVRMIRKPNGGLSDARMAGVRGTSARYVFPLDADDRLLPGALARLADELDRDPALDLAWGNLRYVGERRHEKPVASELDPWLVTYLNDLPASALVRRDALLQAGGWSLPGPYEDWDLWMALAERGARGRGLGFPVYEYRVQGARMYRKALARHGERHAGLRARHPQLFAARSRNRRRSSAPGLVKLVFPALDAVWPGMSRRKGSLLAVLLHVASGRGGLHRPFVRKLRRLRGHTVPGEEAAHG
jgi:glycosyltransferase involved in cell wall biosynthesis